MPMFSLCFPALMLVVLWTPHFLTYSLYAQEQPAEVSSGAVELSGETFEAGKLIDLSTVRWRFQEGDNPAWADPSLDDATWELTDTDFQPDSLFSEIWQGLGWFRLHLRVDSALHNTILGVSMYHLGASEIYLDGQYVGGFGVIGASAEQDRPYTPKGLPLTLALDDRETHTLAVRYANRSLSAKEIALFRDAPYLPIGFAVVLGPNPTMLHSYINGVRSFWTEGILGGILIIMALLHLVLFLFDRHDYSYLFFGIATASAALALTLLSAVQRPQLIFDGATDLVLLGQVGGMGVMLFFLFLLLTFYAIFARQWIRYAWGFVVLASVFVALQNVGSRAGTHIALLLALIFVLETIRITVYAIYKRKEGAKILGVGVLMLLLVLIFGAATGSFDSAQSLSRVSLWMPPRLIYPSFYDIALFVLPLPIAMSVLLARRFARRSSAMREAELRAALAEEQTHYLEALDQAKSRFFANISHEFRTPLTLLLGPLQEALDGEDHGKRLMQHVPLMYRNAGRLLRLVNQLLDLAKLEAGSMRLHLREIDLVVFLRHLVLAFAPQAERDGLTLLFDTTEETLPGCFVDPDKLEKIVTNLVSNAFKFTMRGGKVHVGLSASNDKAGVILSVSDTGRGISEDELPHVFDRFYQVSSTKTREYEGTGIGLALVKELVELQKGTIEVESKRGFGTTFTIYLPVGAQGVEPEAVEGEETPREPYTAIALKGASPEAVAPIIAARPEEVQGGEIEGTVLVVDDSADVRSFICSHLETHFRMLEAADGEAGLALIHHHHPDLVISDVMMPKLDGYDLCRAVKADDELRHIPVILLTAKAEETDKVHGLEGGADDYLTKPFSVRELEVRVSNLILSRQHLRRHYSSMLVVPAAEVVISSDEEAFMTQVLDVMNRFLGNSDFSTDQLANEVNLSRRQVERKVKALTGQTPPKLMRRMRLERAAQILAMRPGSIAEVAYAVGFKSPAHFSSVFRKAYGHPPSEHIGNTT